MEATLEIIELPASPDLVFWAVQASFVDRGRRLGAGHLGLQWHPGHPGSRAVNWGGYDTSGRELSGSSSVLPSSTGNANTRDLDWRSGIPYRLRIERCEHGWRGSVIDPTGATAIVRDLVAGGAALTDVVVWTECFAPCDALAGAVAWSDLTAVDPSGRAVVAAAATVGYQRVDDGGCATSDSTVDGDRFVQRTGVARTTSPGARLTLRRADQ